MSWKWEEICRRYNSKQVSRILARASQELDSRQRRSLADHCAQYAQPHSVQAVAPGDKITLGG